jgi:hypothetical protein
MHLSRGFYAAAAAGAATVTTCAVSRWPLMATWGSTETEVLAPMPGDDLIGQARYRSTHAVTIDAAPSEVWPWLVQMGQGRGGLYSYDWIENLLGLHMHSADRIDTDLQGLAVGDPVRLVPEGTEPPLRFVVAQIDEPSVLVLGPDGDRDAAFSAQLPFPCWTFQLTPAGADRCRLVVRFQMDFDPTPLGWMAYKYALQPVHFVMERKMLLGIKQRAEVSATSPAPHLTTVPA